jgi:hypothetical protein
MRWRATKVQYYRRPAAHNQFRFPESSNVHPAYIIFLALAATATISVCCASGSVDSVDGTPGSELSATVTIQSDNTGVTATTAPEATAVPAPEFSGYDFELSEGAFWEYRWSYVDGSCYRFQCNSDKDDGVSQVTLGAESQIEGVPVYDLNVSGKPAVTADGEKRSFAPPWSYMGVDGDRIVVSNGNTLVTLFDGGLGKWAGSGFFNARFDDDELVTAQSGSMSGSSEIADWPGVQSGSWQFVGRADSQSACEVIAKYRICPNEDTFSFSENEYYRAGIGPVGYSFQNSQSFNGLESSFSTTEWVALTASSLRGDVPTVAPAPTTVPLATPAVVQSPTPFPTALALPGGTETATAGPFLTPTPIAATTAGPIPEIPRLTGLVPLFGPVDGGLPLDPSSGQIPDFSSGLSLDRAIVRVDFTNPDISDERWSYGLTFRQSDEETFHAVYFTGDGTWGHFTRTGIFSSEVDMANGAFSFDIAAGETNKLALIFEGTEGQLLINGEFVATLVLNTPGALGPGDIRVMSGLLATDLMDGSLSEYSDFIVLPHR